MRHQVTFGYTLEQTTDNRGFVLILERKAFIIMRTNPLCQV